MIGSPEKMDKDTEPEILQKYLCAGQLNLKNGSNNCASYIGLILG